MDSDTQGAIIALFIIATMFCVWAMFIFNSSNNDRDK